MIVRGAIDMEFGPDSALHALEYGGPPRLTVVSKSGGRCHHREPENGCKAEFATTHFDGVGVRATLSQYGMAFNDHGFGSESA